MHRHLERAIRIAEGMPKSIFRKVG
jgi:hypothetical protein